MKGHQASSKARKRVLPKRAPLGREGHGGLLNAGLGTNPRGSGPGLGLLAWGVSGALGIHAQGNHTSATGRSERQTSHRFPTLLLARFLPAPGAAQASSLPEGLLRPARLCPELREAFAPREPVARLDYNTTYPNCASKGSPPNRRKLRKRAKKIPLHIKMSHFCKIRATTGFLREPCLLGHISKTECSAILLSTA